MVIMKCGHAADGIKEGELCCTQCAEKTYLAFHPIKSKHSTKKKA